MHIEPWHKGVVTAVLVGLGIAAALVAIGVAFGAAGRGDDLWFEVAKGGVSLGVIAVLGGIIGFLLREVDSTREDARRDREFLRDFYTGVRDAYFDLKDVRRRLRAAGVLTDPGVELPAMRVGEIRSALRDLDRAQLKFESAARAIDAEPERYPSSREVYDALRHLERYGQGVIREWEQIGKSLWPGSDGKVLEGLEAVGRFITPSMDSYSNFEEDVASQMDIITRAFFPAPSA